MATCEKHPVRKALVEIERLEKENALLRATFPGPESLSLFLQKNAIDCEKLSAEASVDTDGQHPVSRELLNYRIAGVGETCCAKCRLSCEAPFLNNSVGRLLCNNPCLHRGPVGRERTCDAASMDTAGQQQTEEKPTADRFKNYRTAKKGEICCLDCSRSFVDSFSFAKPKCLRCGGHRNSPVVSRRKTCDAAYTDPERSSDE